MHWRASWMVCVLVAGLVGAADPAPEVQAALERAGPKVGATFRPLAGAPGSFAAAVTAGLATCERIDVEVRVPGKGDVELVAYPCLGGARIDARKAADRAALDRKLAAPDESLAPFVWVVGDDAVLCARRPCAREAAALEQALLAVSAVDRALAGLLPALGLKPRLTEAEITARLREAAAADEAGRNRILAGLAPYVPELTPATGPGRGAFHKLVMNARGTAFDAFRFRVPAEGGDRRLVWAFAYPPGTAKGWYIAPVAGDAPKFVRFHLAKKLEGTHVPPGHAVIFQRTETPLRAGAEYVVWFQFKVTAPVEMHFALGCLPWSASDRDGLEPLSAALGFKASR